MNNTDNTPSGSRIAFQKAVKEIESALSEYKSSFPKNFGDMFRSKLTALCVAFAVYCILSAIVYASFPNIMKAFFVSLPMFFAAILLSYKPTEKNTYDLMAKRNSLKAMEEYPDVKKYAEGLETEVKRIEVVKKSYKSKMNSIYFAFVAILAAFLIHTFVTDNTWIRADLENIHPGENCGNFSYAAEYFNLEPKKPFVSIRPFDPGTTPNNADIFIVNLNTGSGNTTNSCLVGFRFETPEIRNSNSGDKYKLTITDTQGKPSNVIFFCPIDNPLVERHIAQYESDAVDICNYLYNHVDELRYKVEKM